ncbi:MAG: UvrD-helicase domain-containing protein [Serpentinimonas sp.]|nr:UvrD-helicase domain-containing protein [Serpentinimonas sp.]
MSPAHNPVAASPLAADWPPQDLLAQDERQREHALDPTRSFIIQAPAGAGKTELLTQRFLALLARVQEPEQIEALTFTNKAAAEMRQRIVAALQQGQHSQPPPEPHKRRTWQLARQALERDRLLGWGLLEQPARLQVGTLDALCARLARQMPLLSRFGGQPRVADDPGQHHQRAAAHTLALLDGQQPQAALLERVLARFDNEHARLQLQLQAMLARRDAWLALGDAALAFDAAEAALRDLIDDELRPLAQLLPRAWQLGLMAPARYAGAQALRAHGAPAPTPADHEATAPPAPAPPLAALSDWHTPLQGCCAELPLWRGLAELLLTQEDKVRSASRAPSGLGFTRPEGKALTAPLLAALQALHADPAAAAALARVRRLPEPHIAAAEREQIADLLELLKCAAAHLWLQFGQAGEVDFVAIALQALQALGQSETPSELQLQLDHRVAHLLIDEFQDTSPLQLELLRRLSAGWQAGDGRTLFLVGDPMQSIYRFRRAEVGLFLQVRAQGLGALAPEPLQLYRNNRSLPPLVDWVNRHFVHVFGALDDPRRGAVAFAPASPTRSDSAGAGVCWHPQIDHPTPTEPGPDALDPEPGDEEIDPDSAAREAQQVVQLIRQSLQAHPSGTVAVLVRARKHLEALVQALRLQESPLPFQAVEVEALAQRQPVQDLLTLTRALHHLADRVHWLALLRAPWCGLLLADLHRLVADAPQKTVWELINQPERCAHLSADGQQRLAHLREVLTLALAHQGQQRPRRWVEGVWQALGGPQCLASASDLADVRAGFEVLDRCTRHGQLELDRIAAELNRLYAAPDPAGAQVQLMTIHKSKGLEFDTVILPGLQRPPRAQERSLLLWDEVLDDHGHERLLLATDAAASPDGPTLYDYLLDLERTRARNEARRLLYVATTRARSHLHLLGCVRPASATDALRTPHKDSLLALLWPQAETEFLRHGQALARAASPAAPASASAPATPTTQPGPAARPSAAAPVPPLADFVPQLQRLRQPGWPAAWQPHGGAAPAPADSAAPADAAPPAAAAAAAAVGTLVHRYLELIAHDGLDAWPVARLPALQAAMQQWLRGQGLAEAQASAAATEVQQHLHTTLTSAEGRWLLAPHPQAASEYALASAATDASASPTLHVIDRTFVHEGRRWIIDYKTTAHENAALPLWRAQLQRYRALFDDGLPVQLALFLTQSGRLLRLADD